MMHILSLETSAEVCSVAIHTDGALLASEEVHMPNAHASKLARLIELVLEKGGVPPVKLSAVAVSSGPGSYTGLRIGTSTAKGLCFALSIPLIGVPTLDILAAHAKKNTTGEALLCPVVDARRMEVYCQLVNVRGEVLLPLQAKILDATSFHEWLDSHRVIFVGNAAEKCRQVIEHPNAEFMAIQPVASMMGTLACSKATSGNCEDLFSFEPLYLKDFVAKKPKRTLLGDSETK